MPRERHQGQPAAPRPEKPPMKILYLLTKNGDRTFWNRAGVSFVNNDGSINVKIDMFPEVSFQLRDHEPKEGQ